MKHLTRHLRTLLGLGWLLAFSLPATAGNLYSWTSEDGTPTYSPEAPPPGTVYTIVGPDLEPISRYRQPLRRENQVKPQAPSIATISPAPKSKWKPVVYTDAPATGAQPAPIRTPRQSVTGARKSEPVEPVVSAPTSECVKLRRHINGLENSFARATSNAEMDQAVLALQQQNILYQERCR